MNDGTRLVSEFLDHMRRRDLAAARALLAPGFEMVFPGPSVFHTLDELVAWGGERYRSVAKDYERFDEFDAPEGRIVYCYGTLHGEWLDGTPFAGVRFIDRFVIRDGLFVEQRVWNDLGELARARG